MTHYVHHDDFLEDGILMRDIGVLADIPALAGERPLRPAGADGHAWELARLWPAAELRGRGRRGMPPTRPA